MPFISWGICSGPALIATINWEDLLNLGYSTKWEAEPLNPSESHWNEETPSWLRFPFRPQWDSSGKSWNVLKPGISIMPPGSLKPEHEARPAVWPLELSPWNCPIAHHCWVGSILINLQSWNHKTQVSSCKEMATPSSFVTAVTSGVRGSQKPSHIIFNMISLKAKHQEIQVGCKPMTQLITSLSWTCFLGFEYVEIRFMILGWV